MQIEVWSDYVCPFCYIGKRRLEAALEQFAGKDDVEIVYRSYELDPDAKQDYSGDIHDMLAAKYGMSRQQAVAMHDNMTQQAQGVGLTYRFDTAIPTNTFDAHRLSHYAAGQGKMRDMTERLLRAYFTESRHIGDRDTLAELAADVGLDREEAARALAEGGFAAEVRADEEEAKRLGIRGVPFFVINRKYAISGAQPSEVFLGALQTVWEEERPLTTLAGTGTGADAGDACADGVCAPAAPKKAEG